MLRCFSRIFVVLFLQLSCNSGYAASLFESDELLEVTLEGPLGTIARNRHKSERTQHPFDLAVGGKTIPVEVRVRGNSRIRLCPFPPLRLKFKKGATNGTPFDQQTTLKLVTHCRSNNDHYENNVLDEYLAYKLFNEISETSFRVRLLRISYTDTDNRHKNLDRPYYGFLIENAGALADRAGGDIAQMEAVFYSQLQPSQTAKMNVFQYLIGNSDWSFVKNENDKACCHNVNLIEAGDSLLPVPRDFDMSGLVNAKYAKPPESTRIRKVTTRLFRGYCQSSLDDVALALDEIAGRQELIMATTITTPALSDKNRSARVEFIGNFFESARQSRDELLSRFERDCIGD